MSVRPPNHEIIRVTITVEGKSGENVLEFFDQGTSNSQGAIVDNIGVYPWKTNQLCLIEETKTVEAGYPVTSVSVYDKRHNHYQINAGEPGQVYAWCPINCNQTDRWISVSSVSVEYLFY